MTLWEYATLDIKRTDLLENLTKYGREGWQVASIIAAVGTPFCLVVFQRPLSS